MRKKTKVGAIDVMTGSAAICPERTLAYVLYAPVRINVSNAYLFPFCKGVSTLLALVSSVRFAIVGPFQLGMA